MIANFIAKILKNEKVTCWSSTQLRDFMHITDAANAIVTTLDSHYEGPINIASGEVHSIGDMVAKIVKYVGRQDLISFQNEKPSNNSPDLIQADIGILKNRIGFSPYFDVDSGLKDTIDWWKTQCAKESNV